MKIKTVVIGNTKLMLVLRGDKSRVAIWNDYDPDDDSMNADETFTGNAADCEEEYNTLVLYAEQEMN